MRRTSIKTLSLTLSVLLAVTVLFSLTFFAGAEAEVALGDLNGDTYVNETDIAILEAVLNGEQNAEENVNHDISGNRMVGYEDLTVLKNMVDPSQPALADKLADGETEDILSMVASIEGAQWEKAVVRGDSTVSLAANATGTIKVLFAEAQDWSKMAKLDIDTLWISGDRTVMVALLGADGETVLGTPGVVAAQQDGWSSIYVPLTGATAKQRESVGGFVITVAEDANVFFDNFRLEEAPEAGITRADMEAALEEVAWDYYLKGGKVQYDSTELTTRGDVGSEEPMSKAYGGTWRTNTFSTLEDATTDSTLFSVCSDYCWNVYYEALGYPILGHRVNAVTRGLFMNTEYPQDMLVARWWDDGYEFDSRWEDFGNGNSVRTPAETLLEMITNYETYLRPGDILVAHGNGGHQHAMLYVGNGKILHCGGGKFNLNTGKDEVEENGAIHIATIQGSFLDGTEQGGYFQLKDAIADTNTNGAWFVIVRPLDVLTVDDDDQDASNDKLDLEYVLDTGKVEYELANNELSPVPTTGFTITDATYSRLQFPGMDINRTVSVKNYGTVSKGGELTYTITITNNSNNKDYPTAATAYSGLVITETVPANTAYVSNTGSGTYANGKVTWIVNVAAGSSVTVSYTVTATGNVGDQIVCGGGTVANIPSNVLTTTIGGQKLNATGLEAFLAGTVATNWNSNDGYKISANASQETGFAERVYNEIAGLDLQLPSLQELADAFFTQTRIHQPYGLHYFYNEPRTRHMYVLNDKDEMAEEYRIYRDMLVEGFFGGVWVYSNDYNNEERIIDPRTKYLEAGDILVYMNIEGSVSGGTQMEDRDITTWRVLVYLGNDTFASLESNGRMRKVAGDYYALAGLTYDMFLVLRPSQAYTDINTAVPAYTGTPADLTDADISYVYKVAVSDVLLNETNASKIAALTPDDGWTSMNLSFATQVYKKTGLDIGTDGLNGATYATVVLNCFDASSSWLKAYEYDRREEAVVGKEALHSMVIYYGGTCFNNPVKLTTLSQLHVGDVLLMGYRDYSAYLCAIYQGGGKFLVVTQQKEKVTSGSQVVNYFTKTCNSDTDLTNWLNSAINESVSKYRKYEGYVILRPSRAYADINVMAVRDMADGRLTAEEKAKISALTVEDWLNDGRGYQLAGFVNWAYKAAQVDVSVEIAGKTANGGHSAIFKTVSGKLTPMTASDSKYDATYAAMLVPGLYGGANVKDHPDRILTEADLRVGDIFASAKFLSAGSYLFWVGIYQGNGQFLLTEITSADKEYTARVATDIIGTDFSQDWMYYYVLRPDYTVERNLEDGALTAEELTTLANYNSTEAGWWYNFVRSAYEKAGVTVDIFADKLSFNSLRSAVLNNNGTLITTESAYTKMLMPGCYGGSKFATPTNKSFVPGELKIGDFINAVCISACEHSTEDGSNHWQYVVGMYIGDGKFLVSHLSNGCGHDGCSKVYIDEYGTALTNGHTSFWADGETLAGTFQYYFVLRPERLAADALQGISISNTTLDLTVGANATLTITKTPATDAVVTWVSSDETLATVNDGVVTALRGGTVTITAYCDGYSASCEVTIPNRTIQMGALTADEMAMISNLTSLTAGKNPGVVAKEVYDLIHVDISAVLSNQSFNAVYSAVTATTASDHTKILLPGYTGGKDLGTYPTFTPNDLKIGDLIMAYVTNHCDACDTANTITGVYIGDGKFLIADKNTCATCGGCYIDAYANVESNPYSVWGAKTNFSKYFILRPERLAADAVQNIALDKNELALKPGQSATLTLAITPSNAVPANITWVTSDANVATVENGKVTVTGTGECVITVYADGYSASCAVTVSMRDITEGALTAEELAAIAEYTTNEAKHLHVFAQNAYDSAGVDISKVITAHVNNTRKAIMNEDCSLIDTPDANTLKMLVPGYYGGKKNSATSDATKKTFIPEELKVGDLFCGFSNAKCAHTTGAWVYTAALYQGNGKFLVSRYGCADCTEVYVDVYGQALTNGYTSIWAQDVAELNSGFMFYFVLRPERLAADALQGITLSDDGMSVALNKSTTLSVIKNPTAAAPNASITWVSSAPEVATVDANGVVTAHAIGRATITAYCDGYSASCVVAVVGRDIADGALTQAEMDALKNYEAERAGTVSPFIKDAYAAAQIDMTPAIGTDSWFTIRGYLYDGKGNALEGTTNFHKMVMPGYYGGKDSGSARTFQPEDFKIGDIFTGAHNAGCTASGSEKKWVYITGMYIGDGKFLVSESHPDACTATCSRTYVDTYGSENSVIWADEDYMKSIYKFYFVLRPERLAADALQGISLNEATLEMEKNTVANLTVSKTPASIATGDAVWASSNTDVATVVDGKITAVGIGTATITAYCDGNSASCEVTVTARNITSGVLTQAEMETLSGYSTDAQGLWYAFVKPFYESAGIEVDAFNTNIGFNDLRAKVLSTTEETDYSKMLVPGFVGGSKKNTGRTFVPADLKVGDIIATATAKCANGSWTYLTGLYVGDGKFLVSKRCCTNADCACVYVDQYGATLTNGMTSFWSDAATLNAAYEYYFVLRPERLAADALMGVSMSETALTLSYTTANSLPAANAATLSYTKSAASAADPVSVAWSTSNPDVATVENGKVTAVGAGTCTITVNCDGYTATCKVTITRTADARDSLTATEQAAIAAYSTDEGGLWWHAFANNAYETAGITADAFSPSTSIDTFNELQQNLLNGKTVLEESELNAPYLKMLVSGYYGGASAKTGRDFVPDELEIGDILCTAYGYSADKCDGGSWRYVAAIYQGEGKFLVQIRCCSGENCVRVYEDVYSEDGSASVPEGYTSLWSTADTLQTKFKYYFVLRPSQLAQ